MSESSRRKFIQLAGVGLGGSVVIQARSALTGTEVLTKSSRDGGGPGSMPYHVMPVTFLSHRLATDHAEGLAVIDVDGDGKLDRTSGAYWYENPGPARG